MASRKEERERLRVEREQRLAQTQAQERKRLILGYAVAGLISLAVLAGIVVVIIGGGDDESSGGGISEADTRAASIDHQSGLTDGKEPDTREGADIDPPSLVNLEEASKAAGCDYQPNLKEEGNTHINPDGKTPEYETQPVASGDHAPNPQADGAYSEPLSPLHYVHALEHGRIAIAYSPDLPEEQQLELKGFFDLDPEGMLLFPDPEMPYDVAAVAWTQLIGCDSYEGAETLDVLSAFRDEWRGRGPEAVPL